MAPVLVIFVHPALEKSRANRALLRSLSGQDSVRLHDLYERYPDFHIDAKAEQALLEAHDSIVFQFPMYWYSSPSLLKEWFDVVLEYGWAYGTSGTALVGKRARLAVTTGAGGDAYTAEGHNHYTMDELLRPIHQTLSLCGISCGDSFYVHGALHLDDRELAETGGRYRSWLTAS